MHFLFREEWANAGWALRFVDEMGQIVPAIELLHEHWNSYTSYWGIFFSLFWVTVPIYWLLGFLGASRLSAFRRQKYVVETTIIRVIAILLLFSLGVGFFFAFPVLNGMRFVRQTSDFLPVLLWSWWFTGGLFYMQAQAFRVLITKLVSR